MYEQVSASGGGDAELQPVRDDGLRMMFTCAHPALDRSSQLALTLRLISGLTVTEIARALLQTETAVGQRITRARTRFARPTSRCGCRQAE